MRRLIESLSPRAEFATVILVVFGNFMATSIAAAFSALPPTPISNDALVGLVIYEVVILTAMGTFLAIRGWRLPDLGVTLTLKDTGIGYLLAAVSYAAYVIAWMVYSLFAGSADAGNELVSPGLQASTVVILSAVNGFFEELFVCGYLINALKKKRSVVFAINVSVAVRLAYHLYQGPLCVLNIVPMGLIFGYWFARTGRLWPLIVAHALLDFLALWPYVE